MNKCVVGALNKFIKLKAFASVHVIVALFNSCDNCMK